MVAVGIDNYWQDSVFKEIEYFFSSLGIHLFVSCANVPDERYSDTVVHAERE